MPALVVGARAGGEHGRQLGIAGRPARRSGEQSSRLVCPRRLERTRTTSPASVPAFEPGRPARLGPAMPSRATSASALAGIATPTTTAAAGVLPLGVLDRPGAGDFGAGAAPDDASVRTGAGRRRRSLAVGTAPMSVDRSAQRATPVRGDDGGRAGSDQLHTRDGAGNGPVPTASRSIVNTPPIRSSIRSARQLERGRKRPLEVKPPRVRQPASSSTRSPTAKLGHHWIADLRHRDPRYRGAAGYGAEIVRRDQDEFVDAAWDQIGADPRRRDGAEHDAAGDRGAARRLRCKAPRCPLFRAPALQVMGPARRASRRSAAAARRRYRRRHGRGSLGAQIARSSLPSSSPTRRCAARPRQRADAAHGGKQLTGSLLALPLRDHALRRRDGPGGTRAPPSASTFVPDGIRRHRKAFDGLKPAASSRVLDLRAPGSADSPSAGRSAALATATSEGAAAGRSRADDPRRRAHAGVFTDCT